MQIRTLPEIEESLYEGTLELETTMGRPDLADEYKKSSKCQVTIGMPQWWNVVELYHETGEQLPPSIKLLTHDADFFLVQLACSFRLEKDAYLDWVRFSVNLRPNNADAASPIAFDLHPIEVLDEKKRNLDITLSPKLKFKEFDAQLGEGSLKIQYDQIIPLITAAGVLSSNFSWDLERTDNHPLRGVRWFHALIKFPHGAEGARARFNIVADLFTHRRILRLSHHTREAERLSCRICI